MQLAACSGAQVFSINFHANSDIIFDLMMTRSGAV